ncbi:MAG: hypothetical protein ACYCZ0_03305 [Minisyncoccota bacterium]
MNEYRSTEEIVADITAAAPASETPLELKARMKAFGERYPERIRELRLGTLLIAEEWIEAGEKGGADREVLERFAAMELVTNAAFIIQIMKRRLGEEPSPARFAIVAYQLAHLVSGLPWDETQKAAADLIMDMDDADEFLNGPGAGESLGIINSGQSK